MRDETTRAEVLTALLLGLKRGEYDTFRTDFCPFAHAHQLAPERANSGADWTTWLILGGRGAGWTAGGGFEYAFWQHWSFKGEYLYVSLGSKPVTKTALVFSGGTTPASINANYSRTSFNVARVGLNYRF